MGYEAPYLQDLGQESVDHKENACYILVVINVGFLYLNIPALMRSMQIEEKVLKH